MIHDDAADLPQTWAEASLRELLLRIETGKSPQCEPRRANEDEYGVLKVSAMSYGTFRAEENKALPKGTALDPAHEVRPGDLLLSRANTAAYVGASVLVPHDVRRGLLLSDKSLRLVPADGVDPGWLQLALSSPRVRRQIEAASSGTKEGMKNISQANLLDIRMLVPPSTEQRQIGRAAEEQLRLLDRANEDLRRLQARFGMLRRAVLDAASNGRLVAQPESDESATELLRSIEAAKAVDAAARTGTVRRARIRTTKQESTS